jgi:hypothetical protein
MRDPVSLDLSLHSQQSRHLSCLEEPGQLQVRQSVMWKRNAECDAPPRLFPGLPSQHHLLASGEEHFLLGC